MIRIYHFFGDLAVIIERAYSGFFYGYPKINTDMDMGLIKEFGGHPEKDSWMPIVNWVLTSVFGIAVSANLVHDFMAVDPTEDVFAADIQTNLGRNRCDLHRCFRR